MARLKAPPSRLTAMRPVLVAPKEEQGRTAYRRQATPWRAWYNTARWQKLRWQVLKDAAFTCAMCGKGESDTSKLVGDHIRPHRGDERLFFDRSNVQCICKPCHDGEKQRQEKRQALLWGQGMASRLPNPQAGGVPRRPGNGLGSGPRGIA